MSIEDLSGGSERPGDVEVQVNGRVRRVGDCSTLVDLVAEITGKALAEDGSPVDGSRLGIAVAVDGAVVPRSRWRSTAVATAQEIEIVTAMQGG
ncbi:sulfur carrier protein ThiS [Brevibacterium sp.]|uniref:sulfur carrier protein ThiS n=1 Tax=Brevibacterium sp. TaxID=1701 RepID=UPI0025C4AC84|nr:sulfur carrier protein ThiS [Brevibacterium sp.]